ncbi:MAG: hypothetical protein AAFU49_00175 [Pseudomonadota bacterium]
MVTARLLLLGLLGAGACTASDGTPSSGPPSFAARILAAAEIEGPGDAETIVASAQPVAPLRARSGSLLPGIGLLALGNTGAGAASLLRPDRRGEIERVRIFGFAPQDLGSSGQEALDAFYGLVSEAMQDAARDLEGPKPEIDPLTTSVEMLGGPLIAKATTLHWSLPACRVLERGECFHRLRVREDDEAELIDASPLTGGSAWRVDRMLIVPGFDVVRYLPVVDELPLLTGVSARLPDWAFLSIPANRIGMPDETGALRLLPAPVLFHRGRAHFFAEGLGTEDGVRLLGWGASGPIAAAPEASQ